MFRISVDVIFKIIQIVTFLFNRHALVLRGHEAELSNAIWNFQCSMIATSSLDKTARIWDLRNVNCLHSIAGHRDEVLDLAFNSTGTRLATASADSTAKIWDVQANFELVTIMAGHLDEISKITFSPPGGLLLTASADKTAKLWNTDTGICSQTLTGHDGEVFSCAFNYSGDAIITASKDNTCKIYRWYDWFSGQAYKVCNCMNVISNFKHYQPMK